jgi:arylsulfatase A-like enzyme
LNGLLFALVNEYFNMSDSMNGKRVGWIFGILLLGVASGHAALTLNLGAGGITTVPQLITVNSLDNASVDGSSATNVVSSGSLVGISGPLKVTVEAATWADEGNWSVNGSRDITIHTLANFTQASAGWGVVGGAIGNAKGGQLLTFTFDLSNVIVPTNMQLRISGFTADTANAARYLVDGVSDTTLPAGPAFTVDTALPTHQTLRVGFSATDAAYKLASITIDTETIAPPPPVGSLKGTRPNIIFFLGDDQNITDQSVYGNTQVPTPTTQAFSQEGLVFEKAFTGQAICAPSRSMLYTGRYPVRNGCFINHSDIRPRIQTLPNYLVPLGYNVILAGKSHVSPGSQFPWSYNWGSLAATEGRPHGWIPIGAIETFLADPGPNPFCMMITSHYPHPSWITDRPYTVNGGIVEPGDAAYKPYYASIAEKEAELAAVLSAVETNGLANDTIIFFSDDHGNSGKFTCYDKGLNMAFMVSWPGKVLPARTSALTSYADFLPTAIELAGGTAPATLDGRSMIPILEGKDEVIHDYVYGVTESQGIIERRVAPQRSIHNGRYHYIWNFNSQERITREGITNYFLVHGAERSSSPSDEEELFDTLSDPSENTNLAGQAGVAAIQAELKAQLFSWMQDQSDYLAENQSSPFLWVDHNELDQDSPKDTVPAEHVGSLAGLTVIPHDITDPNFGLAGTDYYTWLVTHNLFGSKEFDEDKDGYENLLEYVLGGDPSDPSDTGYTPTIGVQSVGGSNVLNYTHAKRLGADGELTYTLEGRTNLLSGSWEPVNAPTTSGNLDSDYENITNRVDTVDDERFLRLKIETPVSL